MAVSVTEGERNRRSSPKGGMPRPLRNFVDNGIYHVTARGVDRQKIFRDDADRWKFLELLEKVVVAHGWSCVGYCQMDNHFHVLVRTPAADLHRGMQYLNGQYARWFNRKYHRDGHLFGGRYHAEAVLSDEHLLEVARYVPLNPVRAGLAGSAAAWPWSSHRTMAGQTKAAWVDVKDLRARIAARFGGSADSPHGYLHLVESARLGRARTRQTQLKRPARRHQGAPERAP